MSDRPLIASDDELVIPAFFRTDANGTAFERWKQEHPDWFVAGTSTPGAARAAPGVARSAPGRLRASPSRRISVVGVGRGVSILAKPAVPVDPRTLSLTHFQSIAAARAARDAAPPAPDRVRMKQEADAPGADPLVIPAQFSPPPPRRMLMPGGGARRRTPQEELLLLRFNSALGTLRQLQPNNRELSFVWDPTRVPSEAWVRQLEREVEVARAGVGRVLPAVPAERRPDAPSGVPRTTIEIVAPAGQFLGERVGRAGLGVRTVSPTEFQAVMRDLLGGATPSPSSPYPGTWYSRPDGTSFGITDSRDSGPTLDVNAATLPPRFRIHQSP